MIRWIGSFTDGYSDVLYLSILANRAAQAMASFRSPFIHKSILEGTHAGPYLPRAIAWISSWTFYVLSDTTVRKRSYIRSVSCWAINPSSDDQGNTEPNAVENFPTFDGIHIDIEFVMDQFTSYPPIITTHQWIRLACFAEQRCYLHEI